MYSLISEEEDVTNCTLMEKRVLTDKDLKLTSILWR